MPPPPTPPNTLSQVETRDADDVATALADFAAHPFAHQRSGQDVALASAGAANADAVATLAAAAAVKSPVSRFGGRALPGMGMGGAAATPMSMGAMLAGGTPQLRSTPAKQ